MKILFISQELIGSGLCQRLIKEGHEVKLYINDPARKKCLTGFVEKVSDWKKELKWVGKSGLIIFDDVGFGKIQDKLRNQGYKVFGGNAEGDKLELQRSFAQKIMAEHGLQVLPSHNFNSIDSAIKFIEQNKGAWVVKQNTHISILNHVGTKEDGSDSIEALKTLKKYGIKGVHLQKKVTGIEVGIARYFNGNDWVGPIEINHEHKRLKNDDKGPLTAEMGTVVWHSKDESLRLYTETLKKLTPYLKKIDYRGDIDLNCIVTKDNIWPLELTPRIGTPAMQLHCELYQSSMADFLYAVASGTQNNLKYLDDYGIVLSIGVPPFPNPPKKTKNLVMKRILLKIKASLSKKEKEAIYLEEISKITKKNKEILFWAGKFGYVGYVTAYAKKIHSAQKKAMYLMNSISISNKVYRSDIGNRVRTHDIPKLKAWGWI